MARLVVTEFVSLDGVIEDPGGGDFAHAGWTIPYWNDDIAAYKKDELFASDSMLLGRVTYEGFAAAWPSMSDPAGFADRMNSLPKHVVTTSTAELSWNASRLDPANLADRVRALKAQDGGDILAQGSAVLVHALLRDGLVDELRLAVYPVVLGSGKRLFADSYAKLDLVAAKPTPSGVVLTTYRL